MRVKPPRPSFTTHLRDAIALKLPIKINPQPLIREVKALSLLKEKWQLLTSVRHQKGFYNNTGHWEILMLLADKHSRMYKPSLTTGPFYPTEELQRSPHLTHVLNSISAKKVTAFLTRLRPSGALARHVDPVNQYKGDDIVIIHVPITTNPHAVMFIAGKPIRMRPGEVWCLNTTLPHEIYNLGDEDRVHLILEARLDQALSRVLTLSQGTSVPKHPSKESRRWANRYLQTLLKNEKLDHREKIIAAQFLAMAETGAKNPRR